MIAVDTTVGLRENRISADALPETCLSLMLMQIEAKIAPSTPDSSEINGMAMGEASLVTQKSIRHKLILSKDSSGQSSGDQDPILLIIFFYSHDTFWKWVKQFDLYFNYQQQIDVRERCDEPKTKQSCVVPLCHADVAAHQEAAWGSTAQSQAMQTAELPFINPCRDVTQWG
ncbi:hypothetical protein TURU_037199 [Turdus rufiventris]|nr:hypothetical protein TURU_037199 [Turdus rufiventris]